MAVGFRKVGHQHLQTVVQSGAEMVSLKLCQKAPLVNEGSHHARCPCFSGRVIAESVLNLSDKCTVALPVGLPSFRLGVEYSQSVLVTEVIVRT